MCVRCQMRVKDTAIYLLYRLVDVSCGRPNLLNIANTGADDHTPHGETDPSTATPINSLQARRWRGSKMKQLTRPSMRESCERID